MLTLPTNWRLLTGGAVFVDVYRQVSEDKLRARSREVCRQCLSRPRRYRGFPEITRALCCEEFVGLCMANGGLYVLLFLRY